MGIVESYSIQQLATHARVSVSSVRYYIQKGDVRRPYGSRTRPVYTNDHLRDLMQVRNELSANVRVGHIRESRAKTSHTVVIQRG